MAVPAALLVGPTGAGKTPYGEHVEAHGFCGRRCVSTCVHLDFGQQLRAAVSTDGSGSGSGGVAPPAHSRLSAAQLATVRRVLEEGALLEDGDIDIVRAILQAFVERHGLDVPPSSGDPAMLLLNGMPRHAAQASQIQDIVSVDVVVSLDATDETGRSRIAADAGGDRAQRVDDAAALVSRKLKTFPQRTQPLIEHFAANGATVVQVEVGETTQPAEIQRQVDAALLPAFTGLAAAPTAGTTTRRLSAVHAHLIAGASSPRAHPQQPALAAAGLSEPYRFSPPFDEAAMLEYYNREGFVLVSGLVPSDDCAKAVEAMYVFHRPTYGYMKIRQWKMKILPLNK